MTKRKKNGIKIPFRKDTFLALAFEKNGYDLEKTKQALKKEYYETSTKEMAKRWGYDPCTIYRALIYMKIPLKPKGWTGTKTGLQKAIEERGGVKEVIHKFGNFRPKDLGAELGFSASYVSQKLKKLGYKWNSKERRWTERRG